MLKIASPNELQAELKSIMAFVHASEKPDRQLIASKLRELADRVAAKPTKLKNIRQMEEMVGPLKMVQSPGPATKHGLVWFKDSYGKLFEYKPTSEYENKKMMQYMGHSDHFPMHGEEEGHPRRRRSD